MHFKAAYCSFAWKTCLTYILKNNSCLFRLLDICQSPEYPKSASRTRIYIQVQTQYLAERHFLFLVDVQRGNGILMPPYIVHQFPQTHINIVLLRFVNFIFPLLIILSSKI